MGAMTTPEQPTTGPDEGAASPTEPAKVTASRSARDRFGDSWIIGIMALAAVLSIGVILGWAFSGGDSGSNLASSAKPTTKTVEITMKEFSFTPSKVEITEGSTILFKVKNDGKMQHDLAVNGKTTPMLSPGETADLNTGPIKSTQKGICTVPGHEAAGMVMQVVVTGADAGTDQVAAGDNSGHGASANGINPDDAKIDPAAEPAKGFKHSDPNAPAPMPGTVHNVTFEAKDKLIEVAPGVKQMLWTFNGTVPGPTLRGKVGDTFNVKLVNRGSIGHSLDFHASETAMDVNMRTIQPGESLTYSFTVRHAGVWMWHCGTPPVIHHIANGMFGAVIIDPPDLPQVDKEFLMIQSELYLGPEGKEADLAKALMGPSADDGVVFNGYYNQYVYDPIKVKAGDRIRVFVLDVGPSEISAFHIIGTQFDTTYKEGAYTLKKGDPGQGGSQVLGLMPAEGGFVELDIPEKGMYAIATHKFNDASRGGLGHIIAD
jgi:nitrite reductase (NO-forming)